ncbi:MAG TPA: hypothetical protein PLS07_00170 [Niabella sp.]|nr:hypothetical protein [Niabella sp.]HQW14379.1 hypothetical protein [Niabella sp.]HQX18342.1 hypothetical protein [Niabella sp.]HQX40166.1 hypothetical protein [Niabella sp.]HRB05867.1 hypothetical protein [Niabella sp.]
MAFIKKNSLVIIGILVGAIAGFLYWKYIGCADGSCTITSRPLNSTAYGAMMGGLLFSIFQKEKPAK